MISRTQILKELDDAIDAMDMDKINLGLDALSETEAESGSEAIKAEDVRLFSSRIKKLCINEPCVNETYINELYKEELNMKKSRKIWQIPIIAASVMLMCLTVYAAAGFNLFSFQKGGKFITMRTTGDITEREAKEFVGESPAAPESANAESEPTVIKDAPSITFDSVHQASEQMGVEIILPSVMPEMVLDSATGQRLEFGGGAESRTVWLTYSDEQGRMFGVTTARTVLQQGSTYYTEHDIDEGSLDSYTSKSGVKYDLLTESDDTGERTAHIAMAMVGEYEYALVFFGFEESERLAVIDSADLSALQK